MNPIDVVKKLNQEICGGDLGRAAEYMADGFRFVGAQPAPLGKGETLGVWTAMRTALPDFNHNLRDLREAGNIVYGVVEVTGTHEGSLVVPHGPTLAATGRKLRNPAERVAITVRDGKVTEWAIEQVPGGGVAGVLGQLS
ncbi:MAG TPA: nuclear transport factor 2 family protein [Polyangiaceae bacterium]|nr:nuclear transport factor 2 family protein [Polyangiaceae bacterium]